MVCLRFNRKTIPGLSVNIDTRKKCERRKTQPTMQVKKLHLNETPLSRHGQGLFTDFRVKVKKIQSKEKNLFERL